MQSKSSMAIRVLTVVLAVVALGIVMVTMTGTFFGGTKVRTLFGASPHAVAGWPTGTRSLADFASDAGIAQAAVDASVPDSGITQAPDAGDAAPAVTPAAP
ncbi:hypothetical protein [Myxococcus sp. Y35]|uniref:hypothetical protein n=1 Tax=Pseudomyxococcus flavus TaxID=3115648 RepID=UPI003CECA103